MSLALSVTLLVFFSPCLFLEKLKCNLCTEPLTVEGNPLFCRLRAGPSAEHADPNR